MCNMISLYLQLKQIYLMYMMQCTIFVQGGQIYVLVSNCRLPKKKALQKPTVAIPADVSGKSC